MDTSTSVFVVIAIVAIVVVALVLRSKRDASSKNKPGASNKKVNAGSTKPRSSEKSRPDSKKRYRATSIVCGETSCAAVRAIEGKRFLVIDNDVPQIPVPQCDAKKCTCVYAHHEDRRDKDNDRRGPRGLRSDLHTHVTGSDRREKRGRRKSDWE